LQARAVTEHDESTAPVAAPPPASARGGASSLLVALGVSIAVGGGMYWLRRQPPREPEAVVWDEPTDDDDLSPRRPREEGRAAPSRAERLTVRVLDRHPHDPTAFTQGLEYRDGVLFEGTGLNGRSTVRRVSLATGEVEQSVSLPRQHFGEGIALVGDHLWQITWQSEVAFYRRVADFEVEREVEYEGEGWGLCHDGERLVMSDGSARLFFRDPSTFALEGEVRVTLDGRPLDQLNELECVDGLVYANVWQTDSIARIDPATGVVTGWIDTAIHEGSPEGARMLTPEDAERADVLNGIAWMPDRRRFLVGGKEWPWLFEVEFVSEPRR
jgi:glutamine cyclotransferase